MTLLLWYVVAVHALACAFFVWRFAWRYQRREPGYRITGFMAYLCLGPALGAARELHWLRVNAGAALAWLSALTGTLLLLAVWDTHLRRE